MHLHGCILTCILHWYSGLDAYALELHGIQVCLELNAMHLWSTLCTSFVFSTYEVNGLELDTVELYALEQVHSTRTVQEADMHLN